MYREIRTIYLPADTTHSELEEFSMRMLELMHWRLVGHMEIWEKGEEKLLTEWVVEDPEGCGISF